MKVNLADYDESCDNRNSWERPDSSDLLVVEYCIMLHRQWDKTPADDCIKSIPGPLLTHQSSSYLVARGQICPFSYKQSKNRPAGTISWEI